MDLGQWAVIGLCVLLLMWFVAGFALNARRLRVLSQSAPTALRAFGGVTDTRRLGNSGAQFILRKSAPPFRQMELVFLLEPRENPLLWLFDRLRGRREMLSVRANLRSVPAEEILVGRPDQHEFAARLRREGEGACQPIAAHPGLAAIRRGGSEGMPSPRLDRFLERQGTTLLLLALQAAEPHLTVRSRLEADDLSGAVALIGDLVDLLRA